MHLSNSYFRCNKSYKTCPVKGTITISFLFEKEFFFLNLLPTLKTEITPCSKQCLHIPIYVAYSGIIVDEVFIIHILVYILH